MWLVQLYKANNNPPQSVYSTSSCNADDLENYIDIHNYRYELSLCNDWDYPTKRGILILNKRPEEITFELLQNERFMGYKSYIYGNFSNTYGNIIAFEYKRNTLFFIDFYVSRKIYVQFNIPTEILSSSNPILSFLNYIKGKTFKIGLTNQSPKYSIVFDDNCKYYYHNNMFSYYPNILVIKNPFLFSILLLLNINSIVIEICIKPRLIEDFNDYESNLSNYVPENDQPLKVDDIINMYFDSATKTGISYNDVDISDDTDNFRYQLIRALLGTVRHEISQNYYFSLDNNQGTAYSPESGYMPLAETPLCIYFPLFRPQLDSNGFNMKWPQYDPNDINSYVYTFYLNISLYNNGEVLFSSLFMIYRASLSNLNTCYVSSDPAGYMPAWRSDTCDFTLPFRFVGASGCEATDDWNNNTIRHNANYLFRIVKSSSSNSYNINGIGCGELTEDIDSFSDFIADHILGNIINVAGMDEIQRITVSESGYSIEAISTTLANYGIENGETCFVLFNESLVEDAGDFLSIHQAVTSTLPNSIVCYIGSDEKIPDTHKNKVIHSDAIVTDLNINESIPMVIKYIRYAKRLYELFNG